MHAVLSSCMIVVFLFREVKPRVLFMCVEFGISIKRILDLPHVVLKTSS